MIKQNFFSQNNLGGVETNDFQKDLKYLNMKAESVNLIQKELVFLTENVVIINSPLWHKIDKKIEGINQIQEELIHRG